MLTLNGASAVANIDYRVRQGLNNGKDSSRLTLTHGVSATRGHAVWQKVQGPPAHHQKNAGAKCCRLPPLATKQAASRRWWGMAMAAL